MIQPAERAAADRNERPCPANATAVARFRGLIVLIDRWPGVPSRWIGTPPQALFHRALRALLVGQVCHCPL